MYALPFVDLPPLRRVAGAVRLPGSKSISNRALLLAGLAAGRTTIAGLLDSDDTRVMAQALAALGCKLQWRDASGQRVLDIHGLGGRAATRDARLFVGNAGTAMRPLAAALALLATRDGGRYELHGVARMHERPIGDLVAALRRLGCGVDELGRPGYPPLALHGTAGGRIDTAQPVRVRGDVSSQFLSALLLALPIAAADADVVVEVDGELISRPYVGITLALLARFGVDVRHDADLRRFEIPRGSTFASPGSFVVEGDASSASYFVAAAAIAAMGEEPLRIDGVGRGSVQGDIAFVDVVRRAGADVKLTERAIDVRRGRFPLAAFDVDCVAIPDAAMTLAVLALYADGPCRLRGIASWRVKETDRVAAMAAELRKVGATVQTGDDHVVVTPPSTWRAAAIDTYDDHRIAMALSLAAFNPLAGGDVPLRIVDPGCVAKTYPDYFETLFAVADAAPPDVPVIAIDGPTASGKGTLAAAVAARLGYALLDSGALYRATALASQWDGVDAGDEAALAQLAATLDLRFDHGPDGGRTWLRGDDVTDALRAEAVGLLASRISGLPAVRSALLGLQLGFRRAPGLVADGRDMGSVVFPDAALKVFLTASPEQRAARRHKQLISKGIPASIDALRADLQARDERDRSRPVAPLQPAPDAVLLDNSGLSVDESVAQVLRWWDERRPFGVSPR